MVALALALPELIDRGAAQALLGLFVSNPPDAVILLLVTQIVIIVAVAAVLILLATYFLEKWRGRGK